MKHTLSLISLSGLLLLGAGLSVAQAAGSQHQGHGDRHEARHEQPRAGQGGKARPGQPAQHSRSRHVRDAGWTSPPRDFTQVHQAFHERRGQIGIGPSLPPGLRLEKGKPLPPGHGKRLDSRALHGLPHYQGYEWQRVGSDVVLVTVATGIVYAILQGVLN